MWREYTAIGVGGALGSMLRFAASNYVAQRHGDAFPLGTLLVNVTGCFLIGFLAAVADAEGRLLLNPFWRQFLMVGMLGGYTTFSSFSLQTLNLARSGAWFQAGLNAALSLILCLLAVWVGHVGALFVSRGR